MAPAFTAVCAACFGFGLARTLFEWQPQQLAALGQWPGTLALVGVVVALAMALAWLRPGFGPAQALPLALPALHALAPNVDLLRGWVLVGGALGLSLLFSRSQRARETSGVYSLLLFLSLFLLYLSGLAPAVGEADTFEFQVGIARLGIAHGSGYPLLMLVGKLFTWLPVGGTLAWRANLTSAFFGALAGVLAAGLSRRLGAGRLPALLAGFAFGVSPTLWSRAVEVEAYTLNAVLVAGLLWLALDLLATGSPRRLPLLAFLFGLSLTNHLTTILLAPALGFAALVAYAKARKKGSDIEALGDSRGATRPSEPAVVRPFSLHPSSFILHPLSKTLLALFLGLSIYLYLPLRWPAVNNGQRLSPAQFANILAGNEARGAFQWDLPLRDPGRYAIVFDKIAGEYGWLGPAALGFGLFLLLVSLFARLSTRTFFVQLPITNYQLLLFLLAYLPYLYFALAFNVPDPDFSAFFIPLHLIAAVQMGVCLQVLLNWTGQLAHNQPPTGKRRSPANTVYWLLPTADRLLLTAFCLLPLSAIWRTLPRVDQSGDWASYQLGQGILARPLAEGATILADSQKIAPLYYLQVAEGVRSDLDIVVLPDEASYRAALDERLAAGQTVYLGRYLPGLGSGYALRSVGPLVEVAPTLWREPPLALEPALESPAVPGLRLLGYAGDAPGPLAAAVPEALGVTLAWQTEAAIDQHLLVSLQLRGPDGAVAWRGPGRVPAGGLYPTNAWRPGEVVTDYHTVPIAPALAPGIYRLEVGLFPPFEVAETGWAQVAAVAISAPSEPVRPARPLRARFGENWVMGYDLPETTAPGAEVEATLYWLRSNAASQTITAFGQGTSLDAWPAGTLVPVVYRHRAPTEADSFDLALTVATGETAWCGWLQAPTAGCALAPVRLAGQAAAEGARNFDGQLLLNAATLETPAAAPGGQVRVTLAWQGLRRMAENYTVFVHLLGPDGLVHGQVDAWPVSGTQATTTWEPGVPVHDPYTIQVPADAPPGAYQVEIGLYLLATGQRLPVLNDAGEVVDDRVLLEGLTIAAPP